MTMPLVPGYLATPSGVSGKENPQPQRVSADDVAKLIPGDVRDAARGDSVGNARSPVPMTSRPPSAGTLTTPVRFSWRLADQPQG